MKKPWKSLVATSSPPSSQWHYRLHNQVEQFFPSNWKWSGISPDPTDSMVPTISWFLWLQKWDDQIPEDYHLVSWTVSVIDSVFTHYRKKEVDETAGAVLYPGEGADRYDDYTTPGRYPGNVRDAHSVCREVCAVPCRARLRCWRLQCRIFCGQPYFVGEIWWREKAQKWTLDRQSVTVARYLVVYS